MSPEQASRTGVIQFIIWLCERAFSWHLPCSGPASLSLAPNLDPARGGIFQPLRDELHESTAEQVTFHLMPQESASAPYFA